MTASVNNDFYNHLGDRWYDDDTHVIALLRAEARMKLDYVQSILAQHGIPAHAKILDIACGAGFVTLPMAERGYDMRGIDLSQGSIETARRRINPRTRIALECENALRLSSADATFDAVLLLDFLEHIDTPEAAIKEAARVLKPGGVMITYTFNRTLPAHILAVKALEVLSRDSIKHVHVYKNFIKPEEQAGMLSRNGITLREFRGLRPKFLTKAFFWSVLNRRLHPEFAFTYTPSLQIGYLGTGVKPGDLALTAT